MGQQTAPPKRPVAKRPVRVYKPRVSFIRFRPTPRKSTPRKVAAKPAARPWVGRPSSLPSHEVLMQRVRDRYRRNPNAPKKLPPLTSKFYTLSREKFRKWAFGDLKDSGVRFRPYFQGNRPHGMRVTNVDPGSMFERLGLYKDDVLLKVNGRVVVAPGQAQKFYRKISKRYRNLTIEFRRGRKRFTVDFSLRGPAPRLLPKGVNPTQKR